MCLQWAHAKEEADFEDIVGVKSCHELSDLAGYYVCGVVDKAVLEYENLLVVGNVLARV